MNVGTGVNFSTRESFRTDVWPLPPQTLTAVNRNTDGTQALTRRFSSGYQLSLLLKDMKIARTLIDEMGPHSSLSDLVVDSFSDADTIAGPGADHTQVIECWEKRAGVRLKQSKNSDE